MAEDRPPVSKRLRFEILRRDNYMCRYCGGTAPDVKLTVDHVVPVALGGKTEPENLVTACADCNAGKASTKPDEQIVADVSADALRWAEAMHQAANQAVAATDAKDKRGQEFHTLWTDNMPSGFKWSTYLPGDFDVSLENILTAGLPWSEILDAFWIAQAANHVRCDDRWRYFYGICRRKTEQIQDAARRIIDQETN